MPEIGETITARELGCNRTGLYVWRICVHCDKGAWVRNDNKGDRCHPCARKVWGIANRGDKSIKWQGGRILLPNGYIQVVIRPNDFYYPMAKKDGYVLEHRLVMAKYLSRCLLPWEVVHHRNGIKDGNRIENLELLPHCKWHLVDQRIKGYVAQLEKRITLLEAEVALLHLQSGEQCVEKLKEG